MEIVENNRETRTFEFADFSFDLKEKILRRRLETISMPPKTCELLAFLLENHGNLLTKEEIFSKVWVDAFVEEANLSHHIAVLRKALGENNEDRKFIETVPRRGYRFVAPVNQFPNESLEITVRERTLTRIVEEKEIETESEEIEIIKNRSAKQISDGFSQNYSSKGFLIGLFFLFMTTTVLVGYWLFLRKSPIVFRPQEIKRITTSGRATAPRISPDGRYILYIQRDGNERSIWIRQISTSSDVRITPPTPTQDVYGTITFSHNGDYVYYSLKKTGEKYSTLYQVPTLGGMPKKILENLIGGISFSPDGSRFAFFRSSPESGDYILFTVNADGTDEQRIAERKRPNHFNGSLSWSPDGKTILCPVFETEGGFHYEFVAVKVADGEMKAIRSQNWQLAESLIWLPDGGSFLMLGQSSNSAAIQIWQIFYPSGEARQITNDSNQYGGLGLTADGRFLVTGKLDEEAHIWLTKLTQENDVKPLTIGDNNYDGLKGIGWTTDGKIVYHSKASGTDAIWIMDADGKNARKIADGGESAVSSDGRFVVFQSKENESFGLRRVEIGNGGLKRLTDGVDFTPSFSPDGKWIYFSRFQSQTNLWRVSSEGGEAQLVTNEFRTTSSPAVSPDGKTLALAYGRALNKENSPSGLALINLENNQIIKTFDVPEFKFGSFYEQPTLQWTPDSKAVNFIILNNGVSNLWQQPIVGGSRVQVTNFKDGRIFNFAFSPDGQQIALAKGSVTSDVLLIENAR